MLLNWDATLAWAVILSSSFSVHASPSESAGRKAASLSSVYVQAHNASSSDIAAAHKIIEDALAEDARLNTARVKSPARNHFALQPNTNVNKRFDGGAVPPLLQITDELAAAASLLTTLESPNGTDASLQKRGSGWWMEGLKREGSVPLGDDPSYKVFRNVVDYGADPTGSKDSSKAIQEAIADGKRCGEKCNGSTTKNAIVYFPSGTYKVSRSIAVYFGTQLIGDANDKPTIKASKFHLGLGVFATDVYVPNGGTGPDGKSLEWYINTARFYSQIRNLNVDIRDVRNGSKKAAFHYQVAQATTIENIEIMADSSTDQQGIFAENGSGGVMSDITFKGGNFGIYGGSQQFSASRMTFDGCNTAVQLIWDWGWLWKKITVQNVKVGFRLYNDANNEIPGSATFVDSVFDNVSDAAILMDSPADGKDKGFTGLVLDNVKLGTAVKDRNSNDDIVPSGYHEHFVIGATYKSNRRSWTKESMPYKRNDELQGDGFGSLDKKAYFDRPRNQYTDKSVSDIVQVKKNGAKGDGSSDDTAALQKVFDDNAGNGKVIYIDAGTYIITDTITIPKGAQIVGETWSQLAAKGDKFKDASKPLVMLRVGKEGDVGSVELQDLILTSIGPTPGAILMEWNIEAEKSGTAALWDVHVRPGGATGTELTPTECPPSTSGTNPPKCQVASMMVHITKEASGYFDNMWLWVADHMIDDPLPDDATNNMDQLSVYCARGMLIESRKPTWLYGTASEHSTFYQYNFQGAGNIYTTYLQTESAYYQPTPAPPAPFTDALGKFPGDPKYECKNAESPYYGCDESWAVIMEGSHSIHIAAAGTYSWFSTYTQECVDKSNCQRSLWYLRDNFDNNRLEQVIAIGSENIFVDASKFGDVISSEDNLAVTTHPDWSHVAVYEIRSMGERPSYNPCDTNYSTYYDGSVPQPNIQLLNNHRAEGTTLRSPNQNGTGSAGPAAITIVNLTPYTFNFRNGAPSPYQMNATFANVPSGKAVTNYCTYEQASNIRYPDSRGLFKYEVGNTGKYFYVECATHYPSKYDQVVKFFMHGMGKSDKEFVIPANEQPTTLVVTGSEEYGDYYVSTEFADYNWMNMIRKTIQNRQLRHVVIPGSHDAGMSSITNHGWSGGGIAANTETQTLDHYNQLRVGTRDFEMRIVSINSKNFYAAHVSDEAKSNPLGATGVPLQEMIDGINRFTSAYPGEVIIWRIRYMVNFKGPHFWSRDLMAKFYEKLGEINNRCLDLESGIETKKIGDLMQMNDNKGCVILLTSLTSGDKNGDMQHRPDLGIYNSTWLDKDDYWGNEPSGSRVIPKLIDNMKTWDDRNRANDLKTNPNDTYAILQWQTTDIFYPLQAAAVTEMNPALYSYGLNQMSPKIFPTVILQDAVGLTVTDKIKEDDYNPRMQILAIGLNLYMVSQNCAVSPDRAPFQPKQ